MGFNLEQAIEYRQRISQNLGDFVATLPDKVKQDPTSVHIIETSTTRSVDWYFNVQKYLAEGYEANKFPADVTDVNQRIFRIAGYARNFFNGLRFAKAENESWDNALFSTVDLVQRIVSKEPESTDAKPSEFDDPKLKGVIAWSSKHLNSFMALLGDVKTVKQDCFMPDGRPAFSDYLYPHLDPALVAIWPMISNTHPALHGMANPFSPLVQIEANGGERIRFVKIYDTTYGQKVEQEALEVCIPFKFPNWEGPARIASLVFTEDRAIDQEVRYFIDPTKPTEKLEKYYPFRSGKRVVTPSEPKVNLYRQEGLFFRV